MASSKPTQVRTVDPFASYNSDTVNKLTRMITFGEDSIATNKSCDVILDSTSTVEVQTGVVYKDDMWIEITSPHSVNFNDQDHYYQFDLPSITTGYYYIVLSYTFQKQRPAPEAEILILTPNQRHLYTYGAQFLLLKVVNISSVGPIIIDELFSYDPDTPLNRRMFVKEYIGTEITLPTFSAPRDTSRMVYVEQEDEFRLGLTDRWSFPIGNGGSVVEANTLGFAVGELVYVTPAGTLSKAVASSKATTADGAVTRVDSTGFVQTIGKISDAKVETGIIISVGDLLYLSSSDPGKVTNIQSASFHQFVGRCLSVGDSTSSINMLFVRGEPSETETITYTTYINSTLLASNWSASGSLYYQDIDISNISGASATAVVWDATSTLQITPEDIEFVSTTIVRIWMPTNSLTLNVLLVGPSLATLTTVSYQLP